MIERFFYGGVKMYCEDCGTRISDGYCPNCQEEAFIFETQHEYRPDVLSDKFLEKVKKQQE